ncbi:hypothetical protein [Petrimonas sp.]|uniref:hypothetical protein n=1 Tax=Petrimonas sp. TaxID=2023866 RepID=UPI003F51564C
MKRTVIVFFLFLGFGSYMAIGQNTRFDKTFQEYSDLVSKKSNILCTMPKEFTDLKYYEVWKIREDREAGAFYNPIIQSADKECIIMYMIFPLFITPQESYVNNVVQVLNNKRSKDSVNVYDNDINERLPRNHISFEMRTALGQVDKRNRPIEGSVFEFDEYVTLTSGKEIRENFNADSLYVYDIPLQKPYKDNYTHCTGLLVKKRNRPSMVLKLFFTGKGKKKEKYYMDLLNKTIWYENVRNN